MLECIDVLNEELIEKGEGPFRSSTIAAKAFGLLRFMIMASPTGATGHHRLPIDMRHFKDGQCSSSNLGALPPFPSSRIWLSTALFRSHHRFRVHLVSTGTRGRQHPLIGKETADRAMDAAAASAAEACVRGLPQCFFRTVYRRQDRPSQHPAPGKPERDKRALAWLLR